MRRETKLAWDGVGGGGDLGLSGGLTEEKRFAGGLEGKVDLISYKTDEGDTS